MIDGTHGTITQGWPLKHFRCTFKALSPQSPECREESCKHLKTEYPAFTALFYAHVFFFKVDYIIQQMSTQIVDQAVNLKLKHLATTLMFELKYKVCWSYN